MKVIEQCPLCACKLRPIIDKDKVVSSWWCDSCGVGFDLEVLEFTEAQIGLEKWI